MAMIVFTMQNKDLVLKLMSNGIETEFVIHGIQQYPKEEWITFHNYVKDWNRKEMYHELRYEYVLLQLNHTDLVIKSNHCNATISLQKNAAVILHALQIITNNVTWKVNDIDMIIDI
jgi:hypothetical protein